MDTNLIQFSRSVRKLNHDFRTGHEMFAHILPRLSLVGIQHQIAHWIGMNGINKLMDRTNFVFNGNRDVQQNERYDFNICHMSCNVIVIETL